MLAQAHAHEVLGLVLQAVQRLEGDRPDGIERFRVEVRLADAQRQQAERLRQPVAHAERGERQVVDARGAVPLGADRVEGVGEDAARHAARAAEDELREHR